MFLCIQLHPLYFPGYSYDLSQYVYRLFMGIIKVAFKLNFHIRYGKKHFSDLTINIHKNDWSTLGITSSVFLGNSSLDTHTVHVGILFTQQNIAFFFSCLSLIIFIQCFLSCLTISPWLDDYLMEVAFTYFKQSRLLFIVYSINTSLITFTAVTWSVLVQWSLPPPSCKRFQLSFERTLERD